MMTINIRGKGRGKRIVRAFKRGLRRKQDHLKDVRINVRAAGKNVNGHRIYFRDGLTE